MQFTIDKLLERERRHGFVVKCKSEGHIYQTVPMNREEFMNICEELLDYNDYYEC